MTQQTINIGQSANDTSGDPLRTAFSKVNANFTELYTQLAGFNLTNSIPSLSGNSGKVLSNNGTALNWTAPVTDINQLTDSSHLLASNIVVPTTSTAPSSPSTGQLWYSTTAGRMYIYYENAWIDANPI